MLLILLSAGEGGSESTMDWQPTQSLGADRAQGSAQMQDSDGEQRAFQGRGFGHLLGVTLTPPAERPSGQRNFSELTATLERLREIGFRIIEVGPSAGDAIASYLGGTDFSVFIRQDRPFITAHQLQKRDSLYLQEDLDLYRSFQIRIGDQLTAFSPFTYPDESSPAALNQLDLYGSKLSSEIGAAGLYYHSAFRTEGHPPAFDFRSLRIIQQPGNSPLSSPVVHFIPGKRQDESLDGLESILSASLESPQSIVLLPYDWLADQLESHPHMVTILQRYAEDQSLIFPHPKREEPSPDPAWPVILLILLFGSYFLHYRVNTTYRSSLFRYFINRRFFAENTLQYRIRSPLTGAILLIQHTVLSALVLLITAQNLFTPLGLEALMHRIPLLGSIPDQKLAIFLGGLVLSGVTLLLSSVWLQILNSRTRFSQSLTLYMWPLQINLPILFLMAGASLRGASEWWITLLFLIFLLVWLVGFNLAALDIARAMPKRRGVFRLSTTGLSLVLVFIAVGALLYYEPVTAALQLALALP